MKTKLISIFALLIVFATSMSFNSCVKEKCTNCLHGGVFIDNHCNCPEGYTGKYCEKQLTPKKIRIATITIRSFPPNNHGEDWDYGNDYHSKPDLYIKIYKASELIYSNSNNPFDNADSSNDYPVSITYLDLTGVNSQYTIELWDKDNPYYEDDDLMLSLNFTPYSNTGGFPSTLYIEQWGRVVFEMDVLYVW